MEKLQKGIKDLLVKVGENPKRIDLIRTPERVQTMLSSFLTGYHTPHFDPLGNPYSIENSHQNDTIVVDNIPFCSLCEHHMVPFFGKMHVSYIPDQHVLGLSRFASFIDYKSRRLQIQENLGADIAQSLFDKLAPKAILVKVVAMHACLAMEGKHQGGSRLITSHFRGKEDLHPILTMALSDYS